MKKISILDYSNEIIDSTLRIVKKVAIGELTLEKHHSIKRVYFAGRTLFVDMRHNDSMTFCHADESVGFFSGGMRQLLSIKSCKLMEELMVMSGINHEPKWWKEGQ